MGTPTRFPNGLSTEPLTHPLSNLPLPNPNQVATYENDFMTYVAGDWTVVAGGAGSGVALGAGKGGQLVLTTATSGSEALQGNFGFNFTAATSTTAGYQTWFHTSVTLDATVANPDYTIGLTKGTLTTINSATDGVYFTKASGATQWSLVIKAAAGSTTTIALPNTTPTASQVVNLGFYYDGKGTLYVFYQDKCIGTVGANGNGTLGTSLANLPASTVFLAPTFLNGYHTGTSLLTVDYVLAAVERAN